MRWIGLLVLLATGLTGCSLTREPKPPRAPEELRRPPDEARYQTPNFYPSNLLNQDLAIKARESDSKSPAMQNMRRGTGGGGVGGMGGAGQ